MKAIRNVLVGLAIFLFAFYIVFVALRSNTPSIAGDNSVAMLETPRLGGVYQWVLTRGHDTSKPVVLFLHGGPGMPAMYLAHDFQRDMERDFVMVHWDRRGAGKSFKSGGALSVSQTIADTVELAELLRERYAKDRIYLVGHSWGSYLGLLVARERPDLFHAFIGTGQMAGSKEEVRNVRRSFAEAVEGVAPEHDLTEDDLFRLGGELRGETSFWPILSTGLRAPEYTFFDALNVGKGASQVARSMRYDVDVLPHDGEVTSVDVPVFFLLGRNDYNTPSILAAEYLKRLESPMKAELWFEESAHFPFWEEPVEFHDALLWIDETVRQAD